MLIRNICIIGMGIVILAFTRVDLASDTFTTKRVYTVYEEVIVPCAILTNPIAGTTNVPVNTTISWEPETGFGYTITLGTSPGDNDILVTGASFGSELITSPLGLPENSDIYVTIIVRVDESDPTANIACDAQQFRTAFITSLPDCTTINTPLDGAVDVILNPTFTWDYAPRATSYRLIVTEDATGTIVFDQNVGNTLSHILSGADQLDQLTTYRATVIPVVDAQMVSGEASGCAVITFTTADVDTTPPDCTQLENPGDGAINVAFSPILSWPEVEGADGYFVSIVSATTGDTVLDDGQFMGQSNTSTPVIEFEAGSEYCVIVEPYRTITAFDPSINVRAINCDEVCFSTSLGCGPIVDPDTGILIDFNPVIEGLEDNYTLCLNGESLNLEYEGGGVEFRWIRFDGDNEQVIAVSREVSITAGGNYRLEVIDETLIDGGVLICDTAFEFTVTTSEAPVITSIDIFNQSFNAQVIINVSGDGDYEYALGNPNGPYQDSTIFNNVSLLNSTVFVRDRNGCGIVQQSFGRQLGFPKFFTPNNDNFNDYWQVKGIIIDGEIINRIQIFDRFGKHITEFNPFTRGWDGTLNGRLMPSGGYWYKAFTESSIVFTGFFALKR